jgi:hypothetical protein
MPPWTCSSLAKVRTGHFLLRGPASSSRSSSSLSAPLAAAPLRPRRSRCPGRSGGAGGALTCSHGPAARPRSSEQRASSFAHLPRPLARPARSPRRSPRLRFVPAGHVAQVAREAKEARSLAPKDVPPAREAETGALPPSRTCPALSPHPAPSPCCSPQLRIVPADPVAQVARKAKEARSLAPQGRTARSRSRARRASSFMYLPH